MVTAVRKPMPRNACNAAIVRIRGEVPPVASGLSRDAGRLGRCTLFCKVVIEDHLISWMRERQSIEPRGVFRRPGFDTRRWTRTLPQQKLAEPMFGSQSIRFGIGSRANQVAQGLMSLIRNPHRGEVTAAQEASQLDRVTHVGLDPITRLLWDQRWSHHHTVQAQTGDLAVRAYPVGPASYAILSSMPAGASRFASLRTDEGSLGMTPCSSTEPSGSAVATAMVALWTSNPTNLVLLLMGPPSTHVALCGTCFARPRNLRRCAPRRSFHLD